MVAELENIYSLTIFISKIFYFALKYCEKAKLKQKEEGLKGATALSD